MIIEAVHNFSFLDIVSGKKSKIPKENKGNVKVYYFAAEAKLTKFILSQNEQRHFPSNNRILT